MHNDLAASACFGCGEYGNQSPARDRSRFLPKIVLIKRGRYALTKTILNLTHKTKRAFMKSHNRNCLDMYDDMFAVIEGGLESFARIADDMIIII
ncbi:MAG: hypothetical protein Pg6C_15560 [Treponemataceae bacterium]|nr:MAG: hypothetical protein Pg6C_15560 [Treponemataceae bacterium]